MLNKAWNKHIACATKASDAQKDDKQSTKGVSAVKWLWQIFQVSFATTTFNHFKESFRFKLNCLLMNIKGDNRCKEKRIRKLNKNIYPKDVKGVLINSGKRNLKGIDRMKLHETLLMRLNSYFIWIQQFMKSSKNDEISSQSLPKQRIIGPFDSFEGR